MIRFAACGNLTRDHRPIDTKSGRKMAVGSLAVDVPKRGGEFQTEFFELLAFGGMADRLAAHKMGEKVVVFGRVQVNEFENSAGERARSLQLIIEGMVSATAAASTGSDDQKRSDPTPDYFDDPVPF